MLHSFPARSRLRHVVSLYAFAALLVSGGFVAPAHAQSTSFISGIVTSDSGPVVGAAVQLTGNNVHVQTKTDAAGHYGFSAMPVGRYVIEASQSDLRATAQVDLTAAGADVPLVVHALKEIGRTSTSSRTAALKRSGTDVTLGFEQLTRSPAAGSFSELLLQLPGAARGANGVVHINGDHGDINYVVDGVAVPQGLNRVIGSEVDPSNVAFVDALQGAYPAQYGEKFAAVLNIATRSANGPAGFSFEGGGGSYDRLDSTLGYHTPVGRNGSLVLGLRNSRDGRALDPPTEDAPHNAGSDANQFLRLTLPRGGSDHLNLTLTHSLVTYQIPPNTAAGAPAAQDDNERQDDLFGALQYRHAVGDHGALSFGPSFKRSRIRDFGDLANDIVATGIPDCSADVRTCGFSVFADRTASDYRFNVDYVLRSPSHEIRAGALYGLTTVDKNYAVTLQSINPFGSGTHLVADTSPNSAHTQAAYLQDSWRLNSRWQLDYGLRADLFQIGSNDFSNGFSQVSPRVKLTRYFGDRASLYAYYGRLFTPFSFENVSPATAKILQPQSGNFDLLPQRDSVYEVGGHLAVGRGDLGLRVAQKNATDLIDDTAVGTSNLHQDINFKLGRIATQTAYYQHPLARNGRLYLSATHTYSVVKNCETQLLAPCFGGPATDWTPADHDQRWDLSGGILVNDHRNGWFSLDFEYGSGLTTAASDLTAAPPVINQFCPPDVTTKLGNSGCKVPPHLTIDVEKGVAISHRSVVTLRIRNLFNDRYLVTFQNAQGNHYARPRSIEVGLRTISGSAR